MSFYSHHRLVNDSDIRLLVIHPASHPDDAVVCDLLVAPLGTNPYAALSYTWGPPLKGAPSGNRSITLCKSNFTVKENLFQALKHLRDKETSLLLWVDAICINQSDNAERNRQVARMADIYRSADQVYAWLGVDSAICDGAITFKFLELATTMRIDRDRSSDRSPSELKPLDRYTNWSIKERFLNGFQSDNLSDIFPELNDPKHDLGAFLEGNASSSSSLSSQRFDPGEMVLQAFEKFRSRNYFFRRWVIQEIFLAQKATLICGNSRIEWSVLVNADDSLWTLTQPYGQPEKDLPPLIWNLLTRDSWNINPLLSMLLKHDFQGMRQDPVRLLDLVLSCTWAECEDPRDRLYSLMSLFPISLLQPDYCLSVDKVYTQFARATIENGGATLLFYLLLELFEDKAYCDHVAQKAHSLPSWVPDWDSPTLKKERTRNYQKEVDGDRVANVQVILENILSCKLLKCCKVIGARKPHLSCSNPDGSCRRLHTYHPPEEDPSHWYQFLRIGQPGQQSPDSLPHEDETADMEARIYGGELEAGDFLCCLSSCNSWIRGSSEMDKFSKFVILRRFSPDPNTYRLVGACSQLIGIDFDRLAGPLEVKIN